jgi:hypothetical protein
MPWACFFAYHSIVSFYCKPFSCFFKAFFQNFFKFYGHFGKLFLQYGQFSQCFTDPCEKAAEQLEKKAAYREKVRNRPEHCGRHQKKPEFSSCGEHIEAKQRCRSHEAQKKVAQSRHSGVLCFPPHSPEKIADHTKRSAENHRGNKGERLFGYRQLHII